MFFNEIKTLFKIKAFRNLYVALFIDSLGKWFSFIGVYMLVYELTGSALSIVFTIIARRLPQAIFGVIGGYVADHHDKRWILILCHFFSAVVTGSILFVTQSEHMWIIYMSGFFLSLLSTVFTSCRTAAVYEVVPQERIKMAHSFLYTTQTVPMIFGAVLAGFLYPIVGMRLLIIINILTFFISASMILPIKSIKKTVHDKIQETFTKKMTAGWNKVFQTPLLNRLFIYNILATIAFCVHPLMMTIYPLKLYNMGSAGVGIFNSLYGFGTIIGALVVAKLTSKQTSFIVKIRPLLLASSGIFLILISLTGFKVYAMILFCISIVFFMIFFLNQENIKIVYSGQQHVGRVSGLDLTAQIIIFTIFNPIYGKVADVFDVRYIGIIAGAFLVIFPIILEFFFKYRDAQETYLAQKEAAI